MRFWKMRETVLHWQINVIFNRLNKKVDLLEFSDPIFVVNAFHHRDRNAISKFAEYFFACFILYDKKITNHKYSRLLKEIHIKYKINICCKCLGLLYVKRD